jgi:hypothetical protein
MWWNLRHTSQPHWHCMPSSHLVSLQFPAASDSFSLKEYGGHHTVWSFNLANGYHGYPMPQTTPHFFEVVRLSGCGGFTIGAKTAPMIHCASRKMVKDKRQTRGSRGRTHRALIQIDPNWSVLIGKPWETWFFGRFLGPLMWQNLWVTCGPWDSRQLFSTSDRPHRKWCLIHW